MWFERFLKLIDSSWVGRMVGRKAEIVRRTDPENIYVENIRSFFNMPFPVARFFCEVAVREKVFRKKVGLLCPRDSNIIKYVSPGDEFPETVVCSTCEIDGADEYEFDPSSLKKIDVYSIAASA